MLLNYASLSLGDSAILSLLQIGHGHSDRRQEFRQFASLAETLDEF